MSRLTKKQENNLSCHHFRKCDYLRNGTPRVETLNKLGKLEDIEDELGCPLDVVFRALKEGVKVNMEFLDIDITDDILRPRLYYSDDFQCYGLSIQSWGYFVKLKDYQKTWWLPEDEKGFNNEILEKEAKERI